MMRIMIRYDATVSVEQQYPDRDELYNYSTNVRMAECETLSLATIPLVMLPDV